MNIFVDREDMEERYCEQLYQDYLVEQNRELQQRINKAIEYLEQEPVIEINGEFRNIYSEDDNRLLKILKESEYITAKEMFEELGYEYKLIDNTSIQCEDVILYTHKKQKLCIQFNLFSRIVVYKIKNNMQEYENIVLIITKELIQAINKQIEELEWNK